MQSGIDWLSLTGPADLLEAVSDWMTERFGSCQEQGGFQWFENRRQWGLGAFVEYGHRSVKHNPGDSRFEVVRVVLPGRTVAAVDAQTRIDWLRDLVGMGLKPTRLDLAADFHRYDDVPVDLVERVHAACFAGHLVGARTWAVDRREGVNRTTGYMVMIGKRGDEGSGRYVRVYDKGLEQGGTDRGDWQRLEVEFSGCVAEAVAARLLAAESWLAEFHSVTFGAIDFRERGRDRHLAARPRVAWWAQFIEKVQPFCVRAERSSRSLAGRVTWVIRSVLPGLMAMGRVSSIDVGELVQGWCTQVSERAVLSALRAAPVAELAFACATGAGSGWRVDRARRRY